MGYELQHGNNAKIDPRKKIVPLYVSSTIVSKGVRPDGTPLRPKEENVAAAKREVDENHK